MANLIVNEIKTYSIYNENSSYKFKFQYYRGDDNEYIFTDFYLENPLDINNSTVSPSLSPTNTPTNTWYDFSEKIFDEIQKIYEITITINNEYFKKNPNNKNKDLTFDCYLYFNNSTKPSYKTELYINSTELDICFYNILDNEKIDLTKYQKNEFNKLNLKLVDNNYSNTEKCKIYNFDKQTKDSVYLSGIMDYNTSKRGSDFSIISSNPNVNLNYIDICDVYLNEDTYKYTLDIKNIDLSLPNILINNDTNEITLNQGFTNSSTNLSFVVCNGTKNTINTLSNNDTSIKDTLVNNVIFSAPKITNTSIDNKYYSIYVADQNGNLADFTLVNDVNTYNGLYITNYDNGKKQLNISYATNNMYGVVQPDNSTIVVKNGILSSGLTYYTPDNNTIINDDNNKLSVNTYNIRAGVNTYGTIKYSANYTSIKDIVSYWITEKNSYICISPYYYTYILNNACQSSKFIRSYYNSTNTSLLYKNNTIDIKTDELLSYIKEHLDDYNFKTQISENTVYWLTNGQKDNDTNLNNLRHYMFSLYNPSILESDYKIQTYKGSLQLHPYFASKLLKDTIISGEGIKINISGEDTKLFKKTISVKYNTEHLTINKDNAIAFNTEFFKDYINGINTPDDCNLNINIKDKKITFGNKSIKKLKELNYGCTDYIFSVTSKSRNGANNNILISRITESISATEELANLLYAANLLAYNFKQSNDKINFISNLPKYTVKDTLYNNYYLVFETTYDGKSYYIAPYCFVSNLSLLNNRLTATYADFTEMLYAVKWNTQTYLNIDSIYYELSDNTPMYYKHNSTRIDVLCGLSDNMNIIRNTSKSLPDASTLFKNINSITININSIKTSIPNPSKMPSVSNKPDIFDEISDKDVTINTGNMSGIDTTITKTNFSGSVLDTNTLLKTTTTTTKNPILPRPVLQKLS